MSKKENITIEIRNDGFFKSRPWCADVVFETGHRWVSWCHDFSSKKRLLEHIADTTSLFNVTIVDKYKESKNDKV